MAICFVSRMAPPLLAQYAAKFAFSVVQARNASRIDDCPSTAVDHVRNGVLRAVEDGTQIHPERAIPFVEGLRHDVARYDDARIVVQDVERAEFLHCVFHEPLCVFRLGDVRFDRHRAATLLTKVARQAPCSLGVYVANAHCGAFLDKADGSGRSDPRCPARDDAHLAVETPHLLPPTLDSALRVTQSAL